MQNTFLLAVVTRVNKWLARVRVERGVSNAVENYSNHISLSSLGVCTKAVVGNSPQLKN